MENIPSQTFLSVSSDETEYYLYPKRVKIESNQKSIEKEEQQKLEQSICCVNRYQIVPNEPIYLSERQNSWALEKEICDRARKTCVREFFHFQTCNSERLPCRVLENKLSSKRWSPENEDQNPIQDDISLNVYGQPLETELRNVWSAPNTRKNLHILNLLQAHQNNNIEQNNKIKDGNEPKQNSSVTPLNRDLFQVDMLSHRSVSEKRWRRYQFLQVPFLCGTGSVLSHVEHEKNNFLENTCSTENKDYYSNDHETTTERDNKEKYNSSYIIPTSKHFKSIRPLEVPDFLMKENTFQFPSISNKINSKMPSTNLKEMDGKTLKGQPSLMQSKQIYNVQKMSEVGNQKLQNAKTIVNASSVGSEFKENNYQSISKQEYSALAGGGEVSVTHFRDNSTDIECNQIFAENDFKENSDGDDDQKSRIHIYICAKEVQNEKFISSTGILKRMGRKSSHENMATFHIQRSIPAITEALEKNKVDIPYHLHNCSGYISLLEAESKLSTKEIFDFKRYLTKNIIFETNCTPIIVQNFPDTKVSFNILRGKKMSKLRFLFQNLLFGAFRTWTESLHKDMLMCHADSITHWFEFCEILNEQCDAQELVKSNISRNHNNKTCICLLAIFKKHQKVTLLKTIIASFFNDKNALLPAEGKFMRVDKHSSCGRKQVQLSSCTDSNLRQNTDFYKKYETYPGIVGSKFVDSISFELHNECQRSHFSIISSGDEKSTFLNRVTLFHNQKCGLPKGRCVRKHHLLSRGSEGFLTTYLESISHKKDMKKQISVAKCLILLQDNCDCSSLEKMHCCNIKKIQYLIRANLRFLSCLPAYSQLKFEKVNNKCSDQQISVTTVKWAKNKPRKMFNSCFHGERLTALPFVLSDNKKHKTTGCRNCIKSTNEVIYKMKKYLGTFSYVKADSDKYFKSKELQINSHNFVSKKSLPIVDTYKKIPLNSDSEDFDQIPLVNQEDSVKKITTGENTVTSSGNTHNLPAKSKDVLILHKQSETTVDKCSSLLLQDSQTGKPEYCKEIDAYNLHSANEKKIVEFPNTCLNSGNIFPSSLSGYQYITSPLHSSSFVNKDGVVSEDGHCRSSLSADKQKQYEKNHATMHNLSTGSPTVTDTYFQLQAKETVYFSLQGHTEKNKAVNLEPATLKRLEYVKEQEERTDEQMRVTNESQCETVMYDLIMSYSDDESKTFIAAEQKLKMHLSIMNNGRLEDVKDEYLPLENKITYEFELKRKFDLVLEELRMFHEISKGNENNLSSVETNSHNNYCELNNSKGIDENMESVSKKKTCVSSPVCGTIEGQNITDSNESSLNEKMSHENEDQEAPKEYHILRLSSEELLHSPIAEGYFLSHEVTRVQPLKTCKGPIRIGLSRKARPQKLHPYLK